MGAAVCLTIGYFFGSFSPAALLSKIKQKNLREHGSGNLGATNTMLVFGLRYGIIVMVIDVLKAVFAHRVAKLLFPQLYLAGLIAACGAVLGHIFPFYMKFQGGKGVACYAGLVLSYDFGLFLVLLAMGITIMFVCNYGIVAPVSIAAMFPLFVWARTKSIWLFLLTGGVSMIVIGKHQDNFRKIKNGEEIQVRAYFGEKLQRKCLPSGTESDESE